MTWRPRLGPLLGAVALAVAAVACGDDGNGTAAPPGDGATRPPTDATDQPTGRPGDEAPASTAPDVVEGGDLGPFDFVADGVQGGQVVGAELAGSDVVVWFWAPW